MTIKKILDTEIERLLLMFIFISIVGLVFLQVLSRFVFNVSVGWSAELSRYLLIWLTWLSASYAIRKNEHIRITILIDKLPKIVRKWVEFIVLIIWSFFTIVMAIVGADVVSKIKLTGQQTTTLGLSMWIVYLIIPLAGLLMLIRIIQQLYFLFKPEIINSDCKERDE